MRFVLLRTDDGVERGAQLVRGGRQERLLLLAERLELLDALLLRAVLSQHPRQVSLLTLVQTVVLHEHPRKEELRQAMEHLWKHQTSTKQTPKQRGTPIWVWSSEYRRIARARHGHYRTMDR